MSGFSECYAKFLTLLLVFLNTMICMKNRDKRKKIVIAIFTNLIIFICIFSVFGVCFWTDTSLVVNSTGYKAIYRGNENNKNVSLCINVYWGTEFVLDMLDILNETKAKATFFVGGMWASENVDILKRIFDDGHEIANHGYYHKDHKQIDYNRNIQEIEITHKLVKEILNVEMHLFMPPDIGI